MLHKAELWRRLGPMGVNDRQRRVINRMFDRFKGVLTTSQYAKLAKCSQDTALLYVRDLVKAGVLVQNPGGGRSTSYRPVGPAELGEAELRAVPTRSRSPQLQRPHHALGDDVVTPGVAG